MNIMLLHDYHGGINLSENEIKEMAEMYDSGRYYLWEVLEEYGISAFKFYEYMGIAYKLGYTKNKRFKFKSKGLEKLKRLEKYKRIL